MTYNDVIIQQSPQPSTHVKTAPKSKRATNSGYLTNYTSGYLNSTSGSNGNKTADAKNSSKDNSFEMFKWNNASYKQYYSSQSDARNKPSDQSKKIGPMEQPTHLKSYQPANLAESSIELSPEKGIGIKKQCY